MEGRDRRCVHVDDNLGRANILAAWLQSQNIAAQVMNEATLGGLEGLVGIVPRLGFRGAEVWVDDPQLAEQARLLIDHKIAELEQNRKSRTGTVDVICDECGAHTQFPAEQQGSVQDCPNCQSYVDIPSDEAEWDAASIEELDEENQ